MSAGHVYHVANRFMSISRDVQQPTARRLARLLETDVHALSRRSLGLGPFNCFDGDGWFCSRAVSLVN